MDNLKEKALNFISQKLDLIQNEDWRNFYQEAILTFSGNKEGRITIGEITQIFKNSGINPFNQELNKIPSYYFGYNKNISQFTFPTNVVSIHTLAFAHSGIKHLIIPKTINTIQSDAFAYMDDLISCIWESEVNIIPSGCFKYCTQLETLLIPKTIKYIRDGVFEGCSSLNQIDYEGTMEEWGNITKFGDWMGFSSSSLERIKCSDGVINL